MATVRPAGRTTRRTDGSRLRACAWPGGARAMRAPPQGRNPRQRRALRGRRSCKRVYRQTRGMPVLSGRPALCAQPLRYHSSACNTAALQCDMRGIAFACHNVAAFCHGARGRQAAVALRPHSGAIAMLHAVTGLSLPMCAVRCARQPASSSFNAWRRMGRTVATRTRFLVELRKSKRPDGDGRKPL